MAEKMAGPDAVIRRPRPYRGPGRARPHEPEPVAVSLVAMKACRSYALSWPTRAFLLYGFVAMLVFPASWSSLCRTERRATYSSTHATRSPATFSIHLPRLAAVRVQHRDPLITGNGPRVNSRSWNAVSSSVC